MCLYLPKVLICCMNVHIWMSQEWVTPHIWIWYHKKSGVCLAVCVSFCVCICPNSWSAAWMCVYGWVKNDSSHTYEYDITKSLVCVFLCVCLSVSIFAQILDLLYECASMDESRMSHEKSGVCLSLHPVAAVKRASLYLRRSHTYTLVLPLSITLSRACARTHPPSLAFSSQSQFYVLKSTCLQRCRVRCSCRVRCRVRCSCTVVSRKSTWLLRTAHWYASSSYSAQICVFFVQRTDMCLLCTAHRCVSSSYSAQICVFFLQRIDTRLLLTAHR